MITEKQRRQAKLLEIIAHEPIEKQEELLARLNSHEFHVTQATVSRDIRELRLVKILSGDGVYRYAVQSEVDGGSFSPRLRTIFRESVTSIHQAQNLVVIKTMPGMASAACASLDAMQNGDIVGSLAGDDTAFIALHDNASAKSFIEQLEKLL